MTPPRVTALAACLLAGAAACYHGAPATHDVNASWRGRKRAEIEGRWGSPAAVREEGGTTSLHWSHTNIHFELPAASARVSVEPGMVDAEASFRPGEIWTTKTGVAVTVEGAGTITSVGGPSLRWGPPNGANLRWGTVLGLHAGMGRLDDTSIPLPSGGAYIGGMLGPTFALVGTFSLVSGTGDDGAAMGFAGGLAAQWWPVTRLWLRAGPAVVLAFDPGFDDPGFSVGAATGAGLAVIKVGTFVLDLRLDVVLTPDVTFATAGVGVNLN